MKMRELRRTAYRRTYFHAWTFDYCTQTEARAMKVMRGKKLVLVRVLTESPYLDDIRKRCFHLLDEHARERGLT